MKKFNTFLLGVALLTPFIASAQTFPLLGNVYDTDCLDETSSTYYWTKNSTGDVIRYQKLKGNDFRAVKSTVKKFRVEGNKVAIESVMDGDKNVLTEIFELKPEKKGFDTLYVAYGADELVKNGALVSDQTRALAFQHLCEPNSKKATLMRSNYQQSSPVAQASSIKKQPQEKCYLLLDVRKTQDDQIINSCDIDAIKNSLLGYNRALLWKFKNNSILEQTAIFSNQEAALFADGTRGTGFRQTIGTVLNYKISGNLTTLQIPAGGNCFVTYEVEEKNGYRKDFYKSASSGCSEAIVNANKIGLKALKSGEDKGRRIIIE